MLRIAEGTLGKTKARAYRSASVCRAHGEAQATQWLGEGSEAAGLDERELVRSKGSDRRKVALARLLWERTTVSQGWLADRLKMGSAANVSQQLRRAGSARKGLPRELSAFIASVKT